MTEQKVDELVLALLEKTKAGKIVWEDVSDPDEDKAKRASFEVTFLAPVQPVPATPELLAGTGIRIIELVGLSAEARRMGQGEFTYVGFVYRATGIRGDTNSPAPAPKSTTSLRVDAAKVSG